MKNNTGEEKIEEVLRQISELKVVEAPSEKEFGRLPKGQIFIAGQMNVLLRIKMLMDTLTKKNHEA